MSEATIQSLPNAPSGIEPEVMSEFNALFSEREMTMQPQRPPVTRLGTARSSEAWWKSEIIMPSDRVRTALPVQFPDEAESTEKGSSLPTKRYPDFTNKATQSTQAAAPYAPRILARYIHPSEHRPDSPPPTITGPSNADHWPTLASLVNTLLQDLISFIFNDDTPAVIEYSKEEVKQKTKTIEIEARIVGLNDSQLLGNSFQGSLIPEKVISIVALVPSGEGGHHCAVSITAKPKRVRQLLSEGTKAYDMAEDMYSAQIKAALRSLGREA